MWRTSALIKYYNKWLMEHSAYGVQGSWKLQFTQCTVNKWKIDFGFLGSNIRIAIGKREIEGRQPDGFDGLFRKVSGTDAMGYVLGVYHRLWNWRSDLFAVSDIGRFLD